MKTFAGRAHVCRRGGFVLWDWHPHEAGEGKVVHGGPGGLKEAHSYKGSGIVEVHLPVAGYIGGAATDRRRAAHPLSSRFSLSSLSWSATNIEH